MITSRTPNLTAIGPSIWFTNIKDNTKGEHTRGCESRFSCVRSCNIAWATAVETIDSFTSQSLKSNIGSDAWKRFFALMGSVVAVLEKRPFVPGASMNSETFKELHGLCKQLKVPDVFVGLEAGMTIHARTGGLPGFYILILDSEKRVTRSTRFETAKEADAAYLELEKETKDQPHIQVVLVTSSSVRRLREAYPNCYVDMRQFVLICKYFRDMVKENGQKPEEDETPRGNA